MSEFHYINDDPVDIPQALRRARALRSQAFADLGGRLQVRLRGLLKRMFAKHPSGGRSRRAVTERVGFQFDKKTLNDCRQLL